ncbi:MAG TPA: hypothetical protein VGX91_03090 [Candidatus Cybelea sp.]|jgi:hypothetical protein|nr:hypothetical protein [Candidatus Cybelea sp.]
MRDFTFVMTAFLAALLLGGCSGGYDSTGANPALSILPHAAQHHALILEMW